MEPIDFSKAAFEDLRGRVTRVRLAVYEALLSHGPCTTRELARRSSIDILTVRPRVTELLNLGWVVLADPEAAGREGIYRALSEEEARAEFVRRRAALTGTRVQGELSLSN